MEEKDKYYTPSIEEFHVGFEYEEFDREKWIKTSIEDNKQLSWFMDDSNMIFGLGYIRVKYLDREDIESLGWKSAGEYLDVKNFELSTGNTEKNTKENQWKLQLKTDNKIMIEQYRWIRFFGTIKNKSELKKLLVQLGIN